MRGEGRVCSWTAPRMAEIFYRAILEVRFPDSLALRLYSLPERAVVPKFEDRAINQGFAITKALPVVRF